MSEGVITDSKTLKLDNFLKVIDVNTFLRQNRDKLQPLKKGIPKGACFDRRGVLYIPWYRNLYRKQGDKKLILYRRSDYPRRTRIGGKPDHKKDVALTFFDTRIDWEWDDWIDGYESKSRSYFGKVIRSDLDKYYHIFKCQQQLNRFKITTKGLSNKEKKELERSINTLQRPIPIYREFRDYMFTQIIPPPRRRRVNPPSFSNVLLFSKQLKVSGATFNFQTYLEKEIERDMKTNFRHTPLMHTYYKRKIGMEYV